MNKTGEVNERPAVSLRQMMEPLGLSRREFLALLGSGGVATMLAAYTPMALLPSSARAETEPAQPTDELTYISATALAKAIRAKKLSSEEVVNAYLQRIAAVNPKLTLAFIVSAAMEGSATRHWGQRLLEIAGTTEAETHPLTQRLLKAQRTTAVRRGNDHPLPIFKWSGFRSNILAFLEKYDAVVCPVSASPALPHGTTWDDDKLPAFSYVMTYSLTGMPVVVVRGGTSPEGLPIGVQVVARPWREDRTLAVAQHIETALGGWQRPPI